RTEIDPDRRDEIYLELNRRFGEQVWELWSWYTVWGIATSADVHGILGPELPDGSMPFPLLAGWHLTSGLWVEQ
ncbi:MAG TPA: ABC transporter substrate-binding protein, partial [Acidimicrobiales bacterium]